MGWDLMIMEYKYTIAAFDFDGTITKRDSLNNLIIYEFGLFKFITAILKFLPLICLYKLGIVENRISKEKLFHFFWAGISEEEFKRICVKYSLNRINKIVKQDCLEKIEWHRKQGHRLIIVSASVKDWIEPWAKLNLFDDVISTKVESNNGILTGRFKTENCYGKEKLNRFLEKFPKREEYFLYVYGDNRGDKEMLEFADKGFYRKFI